MTATVIAPSRSFAPIGLDELTQCADLQTRVDRKYVLSVEQTARLMELLDPATRVLTIDGETSFNYESVYFDTPDLDSFRMAALRRRRRFKVRTRSYVDSGLCWLEVKTRGPRGATVKHRLSYDCADRATVDPGRWFVDQVFADESIAVGSQVTLTPVLTTKYRRTTLYLPTAGSRVTVDSDLRWYAGDEALRVPDMVIVETKTASAACCVDRLLWASNLRPARISKYATGLAALRPELPVVPWRRTLRRYFPPAPTLSCSPG